MFGVYYLNSCFRASVPFPTTRHIFLCSFFMLKRAQISLARACFLKLIEFRNYFASVVFLINARVLGQIHSDLIGQLF
jgi:hypothetical protein